MVRIFLCCIMDCDSWLCVSSHDAESARNYKERTYQSKNPPSVNQKIFTESMTSYLTFINIEKNLGDERFDLVKHVVLLVYGDNCVMTCESDQAL